MFAMYRFLLPAKAQGRTVVLDDDWISVILNAANALIGWCCAAPAAGGLNVIEHGR
jgi:hypothetical protein